MITPTEMLLYIDLVASFFARHGRDPDEVEGRALLQYCRMVMADAIAAIPEQGVVRDIITHHPNPWAPLTH